MKNKQTYEQVNTITWIPEGQQWGSAQDFSYAAPKRVKTKLILTSIVLGVLFSFHNPMTTYKNEVVNAVEINVELKPVQSSYNAG